MMKKGLTQVELLLAIGILGVLLALGAIVFGSFARQDQVLVEARKIESVLNEAKMKTMAGLSLGGSQALNFGVYFANDRYFLFPGLVYDPQNSQNQEFLLPEAIEIKWLVLPADSVVFAKISGEVWGFDPSQNYLVLSDQQSDEEKKISINQLGTVTVAGF